MCNKKLTSLQRVKKAFELEKGDVVPVGTFMGNHAASIANIPLKEYYNNSDRMVEAQLYGLEEYKQDIVIMQSDNYYIAEGFGTTTTHYENSTPTFESGAIKDLSEVKKLKIPDPYEDGRMPIYLNAISKISKIIGNDVAIRGTGTGPFSLASHLIGTEKFIMDVTYAEYNIPGSDKGAIHYLMDICSEALTRFLIAEIKSGAHIVMCGDSLASLDIVSPDIYKHFILPYEQKVFAGIQEAAKEYNAYSLLHICGNNTKVLDLYGLTGADCYEVDYKVDIKEAHDILGRKMALMGNIDPSGTLLQGSPEDVERAAIKCIEEAGMEGGFILGSGCEVPMDTPRENMRMLVDVARRYMY